MKLGLKPGLADSKAPRVGRQGVGQPDPAPPPDQEATGSPAFHLFIYQAPGKSRCCREASAPQSLWWPVSLFPLSLELASPPARHPTSPLEAPIPTSDFPLFLSRLVRGCSAKGSAFIFFAPLFQT